MASRRLQRQYAFVLSVLAHAAIVAMLTFSVSLSGPQAPPAGNIVPVNSVLIDSTAVNEEIARIEAEEAAAEAERIRQQEAEEAARQEEIARQERIAREQEAAEQAAREEAIRIQQEAEEAVRLAEERRLEEERLAEERRLEEERLAELERQRQEEERRQREEEERRQREEAARLAAERAELERVEADIQAAIDAERQAREARDSGLRAQWAAAIGDRVGLYWTKPPNAGVGLECVVIVTQLPNGEVVNVDVESCNRNDANIIRSVENAVLNASPLPPPPRGVPFERVVRITFSPTD